MILRLLLHLLWIALFVPLAQGSFNYEIGSHVVDVIKTYFEELANLLSVPKAAIYLHSAPSVLLESSYAMNQFFPCIRVYGNISFISAIHLSLDANGKFIGYSTVGNQYFYQTTDTNNLYGESASSLMLYTFNVNWQGSPINLFKAGGSISNLTFDPRQQHWYTPVKENRTSLWSNPYISMTTLKPTISLVFPLLNISGAGHGDKAFYGTLAMDVVLDSINTFLGDKYASTDVSIFLVDVNTGCLIGNSLGAVTSVVIDDVTELVIATESDNNLIATVSSKLISLDWPSELVIMDGLYIQSVEFADRIDGLVWRIVVMSPATVTSEVLVPSQPLYPADIGIASLGLIINVAALSALMYYRDAKVIRLSHPRFTFLIVGGGLLLSLACFFLVGENTVALCFIRPYMFNLSFTLAVSALLIRGWAVHRRFSTALDLEAVINFGILRRRYLFLLICMFLGIDLAIMTVTLYGVGGSVGTGTDPVTVTTLDSGMYTTINQCKYESNIAFERCEIVYKGALVAGCLFYCYYNRKFAGAIAASRTLTIMVYNIAVISSIVLIVRKVLRSDASDISVQIAGISVCVGVNAILLVAPYIYWLHTLGDDGATADVIKAVQMNTTLAKLDTLPVHAAIVHRSSTELILKLIKEHMDTVFERIEGKTAFDFAIENNAESPVILELMRLCLPFKPDKSPVDDCVHGFAWPVLAQSDHYVGVVETVLEEYSQLCFLLANAKDATDRVVINIASPACRDIISKATYFMRRYEVLTSLTAPHYKSATTVVHIAVDHASESKEKVVLKFMVNKHDYEREVISRTDGEFDDKYVMSINEDYDCTNAMDVDVEKIRAEFVKHGFSHYPYCIIMPAGNRNLFEVLASESHGDKLDFLKFCSLQLMKALHHIHSRGFIHGDVKPQNIIRIRDEWVLTDFDSSANIETGFSGFKLRSAYAPPELVHVDENSGKAQLKSIVFNQRESDVKADLPYDLVPASCSHDSWALGVVLYRMASGEPLFLANGQDDIDNNQMLILARWDASWLESRLTKIEDVQARNMISQLLTFNPENRPLMGQLMHHPFITGNTVARMIGQEAEFDVFLSYRVASDHGHAEILYHVLTKLGLNVWWDKKCLEPGEDWESGFCDGLCNSSVFVALLSKGAVNHPERSNQNFAMLTPNSPCDNVLLEHRLALDLNKRGLIAKMFPVMIGEIDVESKQYLPYHWPDLKAVKAVVVENIEKKLNEHLARQCLGSPLLSRVTVKDSCDMLTRNQGCFIVGQKDKAFEDAAANIVKAVEAAKQRREKLKCGASTKVLYEGSDHSYSETASDYDSGSVNMLSPKHHRSSSMKGLTSFYKHVDGGILTRPLTPKASHQRLHGNGSNNHSPSSQSHDHEKGHRRHYDFMPHHDIIEHGSRQSTPPPHSYPLSHNHSSNNSVSSSGIPLDSQVLPLNRNHSSNTGVGSSGIPVHLPPRREASMTQRLMQGVHELMDEASQLWIANGAPTGGSIDIVSSHSSDELELRSRASSLSLSVSGDVMEDKESPGLFIKAPRRRNSHSNLHSKGKTTHPSGHESSSSASKNVKSGGRNSSAMARKSIEALDAEDGDIEEGFVFKLRPKRSNESVLSVGSANDMNEWFL